MMTFSELLAKLQNYDTNAPLVFMTESGEIGAGYHVTELRHSFAKGIDCGGNIDSWQEGRLQLLDGNGSTHMSVGKFNAIVRQSISLMPELAQTPFLVEFAHGNKGLTLMTVSDPVKQMEQVVLQLGESRAMCKPAQRSKGEDQESGACCGGSGAAPCCGSQAKEELATGCCG